MIRAILIQCALVLMVAGCIQEYSQGPNPCQCDDGWRCCVDTGTCVLEEQSCKSEGKDGGVDDGRISGKDGGEEGGSDVGNESGDDVLIATRTSTMGMGASPSTDQVIIFMEYGIDPAGCHAVIGRDTPHSGPGTKVFDATSEPGFEGFVICMTNGINDSMTEGVEFYPGGNGAGGLFYDSDFWLKSPDFAGCTISRIRLVVSSLDITNRYGWSDVDGEWVWEIWGKCGG